MMNDLIDPLAILQQHEEMINIHTEYINNLQYNLKHLEPVINNHSEHIDRNTDAVELLMREIQSLSARINALESLNKQDMI